MAIQVQLGSWAWISGGVITHSMNRLRLCLTIPNRGSSHLHAHPFTFKRPCFPVFTEPHAAFAVNLEPNGPEAPWLQTVSRRMSWSAEERHCQGVIPQAAWRTVSCSPGHMLEPLTLRGSLERLIREADAKISLEYLPRKHNRN